MIPAHAHAQKPALVQNIDEKGRNPYQQTFQFSPSSTATSSAVCTGTTCVILFKPVPTGYRLVVTQISFTYVVASTGAVDNTAALISITSTTAPLATDVAVLPVPTLSGNRDDLNAPLSFYVEPGLIPVLELSNVQLTNGAAIVGITGYLVALNE
jgi:hypothetical protein